jgi:D-alanyl-D-alanine dipeptidase
MALVEITPQEYDVEIDIVYATDRNFTGAPIYKRPACYLHQDAAACLKKASIIARRQGVKFRLRFVEPHPECRFCRQSRYRITAWPRCRH